MFLIFSVLVNFSMQGYIRKGAENVQVLGTSVACYNRITYLCVK